MCFKIWRQPLGLTHKWRHLRLSRWLCDVIYQCSPNQTWGYTDHFLTASSPNFAFQLSVKVVLSQLNNIDCILILSKHIIHSLSLFVWTELPTFIKQGWAVFNHSYVENNWKDCISVITSLWLKFTWESVMNKSKFAKHLVHNCFYYQIAAV